MVVQIELGPLLVGVLLLFRLARLSRPLRVSARHAVFQ